MKELAITALVLAAAFTLGVWAGINGQKRALEEERRATEAKESRARLKTSEDELSSMLSATKAKANVQVQAERFSPLANPLVVCLPVSNVHECNDGFERFVCTPETCWYRCSQ